MQDNAQSVLNAQRRSRELSDLGDGDVVDVLVIGGGITGVGTALDAASRGLRTVLVDKHDLAFGTSRWSSKLAHGGLRYLASGNVGIARESAVERGILMTRTAPHLVRALPQLVPLLPSVSFFEKSLVRTGFLAGDALRITARTPASVLPRSRRVGAARAAQLAPAVRRDGLRGGLLAFDGQLVDDARLVVALARTAAAHSATILTRVGAYDVTGESARLRDEITGEEMTIRARAVVNAAGVWAGQADPDIRLKPSRGTHLVLPAELLGNPTAALTVPIPGETNRFVFALPAQLGRVYLGLTDEAVDGPLPDVPAASDGEIDFLLDTVNTALATPITRADVVGTYAGLRPLLDSGEGKTAGSVPQPCGAALVERCRQCGRRQAHDVPEDGAGCGRCGSRRRRSDGAIVRDDGPARSRGHAHRASQPAAVAGRAVRQRGGPGGRGGGAHADRRGYRRHARRTGVRGEPRGRARRRRSARPPHPDRIGRGRSGAGDVGRGGRVDPRLIAAVSGAGDRDSVTAE